MITKILSSRGRQLEKPSKLRKDYTLFAHASDQWAKKVRGKRHYFRVWDGPIAAELGWDRQKEALLERRGPDEATPGETIGWLCNAFLDSKAQQQERGELPQRA